MDGDEPKRKSPGKNNAIFAILVAVCIGSSIAGQMFFPGPATIPTIIRTVLAVLGLLAIAVGSEWLLKREFGSDANLGIRPGVKAARGFAIGIVGAFVLLAILAAALWIAVPFHFERGSLSLQQVLPELQNFALSNIGEELVFRGYLLLALMRRFGLRIALFVVGILFGLFHLPGLSGIAAVKMVITTFACSYLFGAAFLRTRTIWAAIALHFFGNVLLHKITGLSGGGALLKPVLHSAYPQNYDPGFWIFAMVPLLLAICWLRTGTTLPAEWHERGR